MTKIKESIVGKIVNGITFLRFVEKTKAGDYWLIKCHCGKEKVLLRNNVITGHTKSCGCKSRKITDLTNKRFGKIICIRIIGSKNQCKLWEVKCDCGVVFTEQSNYIIANRITSCGCDFRDKISKGHIKDITNQKFNRLTAIEIVGQNKSHQKIWLCKCDCGKLIKTEGSSLRCGRTKSCGCLHSEIMSKRCGIFHSNFNHSLSFAERLKIRKTEEYYRWTKKIKRRDKTCKKCGNNKNLHAHHILPYHKYPEKVTDLNNGIALCKICHRKFHNIYGNNVDNEKLKTFLGI